MPTRIVLVSIVTNIVLTLLKIIGGVLAGSSGLVADGFHSLSDVIAMSINYFGLRISLRPADGLEAYDNYKKEIIGTFVVSFALFVIGLFILIKSYLKLTAGIAHSPGLGAILIVIVAFVINIRLYYYSRNASQDSDSPGLAINTEQLRLNILSTIAVLIGIVGSCFNINVLDITAAIIVALIILYSSVDIIFQFIRELEHARLTPVQLAEIESLVGAVAKNTQIARLKTMLIRKKIWLLLELTEAEDAPISSGFTGNVKNVLLSKLSFLDNVIVAGAPPRASGKMKVEVEDFKSELGAARNYLCVVFLAALILVGGASASGVSLCSQEYHVLIPADMPDVNSGVSAQLGRAPYFYLYRIDKGRGQFITNHLAFSPREVDLDVARLFKNYSVEAVITQSVGPHMFEELNPPGIVIYMAEPKATIQKQIDLFQQGNLTQLTKPNVNVEFGLKNLRLLKPWYNWQRR